MTQRQRYSEEIKAAAVADMALIGANAASVKYGIPPGTLRSWQSRADPVATLKREHIGALVATYLEANLQALTTQAYVTSDPEYINRQPAGELAILHGVMADKSIRLLEALHAGQRHAAELAAGGMDSAAGAADPGVE